MSAQFLFLNRDFSQEHNPTRETQARNLISTHDICYSKPTQNCLPWKMSSQQFALLLKTLAHLAQYFILCFPKMAVSSLHLFFWENVATRSQECSRQISNLLTLEVYNVATAWSYCFRFTPFISRWQGTVRYLFPGEITMVTELCY